MILNCFYKSLFCTHSTWGEKNNRWVRRKDASQMNTTTYTEDCACNRTQIQHTKRWQHHDFRAAGKNRNESEQAKYLSRKTHFSIETFRNLQVVYSTLISMKSIKSIKNEHLMLQHKVLTLYLNSIKKVLFVSITIFFESHRYWNNHIFNSTLF